MTLYTNITLNLQIGGTRKIKFLFKERSEKGFPNEPVLCATQKYGVIPQTLYENRVVVGCGL